MFRFVSCKINKAWQPLAFQRCFHRSPKMSSEVSAKKTVLCSFHETKGGKMVEFGGYAMPVVYKDLSISESHLHTRQHASIFDVSHMLQTRVRGKHAIDFMESLTVADVRGLNDNQGSLTLFTNEKGGIMDDLIVTKTTDGYLYVVSNAGCREKDQDLMESQLSKFKADGKDVALEDLTEGYSLLALQGPSAHLALQKLVKYELSSQYFMFSREAEICGATCRITRCGYTGEDGFEISIPNEKAVEITETLLDSKEASVKLAGLGARDSLRLEAGLCLYGNDIDETTTPVEAVLMWTVGKVRRQRVDFKGAETILKQLKDCPPSRKRVGLSCTAGPPARSHAKILDSNKNLIGEVTSGCPSPSLSKNIAMGYVPPSMNKAGSKVFCDIRGKLYEYQVTKMPFVPSKYYLPPK